MQQMFKLSKQEDDETTSQSAFHPLSSLGKSPTLSGVSTSNRDSGYGTDFSPASIASSSRRFTYEESDIDLSEQLDAMDIHNDVFDDVIEEADEADDTDKEVEHLLNEQSELRHPVSQPIPIQRPSAPIPSPGEKHSEGGGVNWIVGGDSGEDYLIASPFHHTQWNSRDRHFKRNRFRPIVSRSVGTQTPSPHSQLIKEAIGTVNTIGRFQPYARGPAIGRLRFRSESKETESPPCNLPDIVPFTRDRSVSLPDVPAFRREHEQEVGRELRRISDEFHHSFSRASRPPRMRTRTMSEQQASSFPQTITSYWSLVRRLLLTSPASDETEDGPTNDKNDDH